MQLLSCARLCASCVQISCSSVYIQSCWLVVTTVPATAGLRVSDPRGKYLGGYIGFGLGYVVLVSIRSIINLLAGWQASRRIHHASMASLCLAPISFFDTTPIGRILNRFAKVELAHSAYHESALVALPQNQLQYSLVAWCLVCDPQCFWSACMFVVSSFALYLDVPAEKYLLFLGTHLGARCALLPSTCKLC